MIRPIVAAAILVTSITGAAADSDMYDPPKDCTAIATLRLAQCVVAHVSRCPEGNIEDRFIDGNFLGRSFYTHPSLFVRYESADGFIVGHAYGEGVPANDETLAAGKTYTYERRGFRSRGDDEAGDVGIETLNVGNPLDLELGNKRYRVLDIRFAVTNADNGYEYRERALMLVEPPVTLGVVAEVTGGDAQDNYSSLPESIALDGDLGFRTMMPAPSCGPDT